MANPPPADGSREASLQRWKRRDQLCDAYERGLRQQQAPPLTAVLRQVAEEERAELLMQLLDVEWEIRTRAGDEPRQDEYEAALPEFQSVIRAWFSRRGTPATSTDDKLSSTVLHEPQSTRVDDQLRSRPAQIAGYEVLAEIARGGMGVVYKGRDRKLNRLVAIKLIKSGDLATDDELRRFEVEAQAAAQLDHTGIVPVYEVGNHAGQYYMVLAYVDGQSLWQRVRQSPLAPREAARLMQQVAQAVQYAHDRQIIHRDLKPQNILLTAQGVPRVTDFGLAKQTLGDSSLTVTGQILGTPAYMPPEQASGRNASIGPHSDIYSLGATLYCLLTGRPPHQASTPLETIRQVLEQDPVPPRTLNPSVDRNLETICLKALAREPKSRYASAEEFAADLGRWLAGEPILARPEAWPARLRRRLARHRLAATALMVVLATVLAAGGVVLSIRGASQRRMSIEAKLQQREQSIDTWTEREVAEQETLLAELQRLSAASHHAARDRFRETLFNTGSRRMQEARLDADDEGYIRAVVELLRPREPELAEKLQDELQTRQRVWDRLFDESPYLRTEGRGALADLPGLPRTWLSTTVANGPVKAEIVWPDWMSASQLGVVLQADANANSSGYAFLLRTTARRGDQTFKSFAESRQDEEPPFLEIWRNGVRLREDSVSWKSLDEAALRLQVQRSGDELRAALNDQPTATFWDPFPLAAAGVFGAIGPADVSIERFTGWRQPLPEQPSPLERADELLAEQRLPEARAEYERQLKLLADDRSSRQEALFKLARTLELLGEDAAALQHYQLVASEAPGMDGRSRWPLVSAIYLWSQALKQKDHALAEQVFASVISPALKGSEVTLPALAPVELRDRILGYYKETKGGISYLQADPRRVEKAERLVEIEEAWNVPPVYHGWTQFQLLRTYRWEDRPDLALELVQLWLRDLPADDENFGILFCAEYGWLLREKGTPQPALAEIDRRLYSAPQQYRLACIPLLIERARTLIALDRLPEAEQALEDYLKLDPHRAAQSRRHSDACLLLGLLRDRRGDSAGALHVWKEGTQEFDQADPLMLSRLGGVTGSMNHVVLGILSGEQQPQDWEVMLSQLVRGMSGGEAALKIGGTGLIRIASQALHATWDGPAGRELAWELARQDVPFPDYVRRPLEEFTVQFAQLDIFAAEMTLEQQEFVREFARELFQTLKAGDLNLAHVPFLATAYKNGTTGILGWGTAAVSLKPPIRGPLAYLLSFRLKRLGRPATEIRSLLESARRDANAESLLGRLVDEELRQLQ